MNKTQFLDGIAHTEWVLTVTRIVLKTIQSMRHHQKFSKRIVDAIAKELGDQYVVWCEYGYGHKSCETYVANRNVITGERRKISFYAALDEPWADKMISELNNLMVVNGSYLTSLRNELAVHPKLQELSDELEVKKKELQEKAMKLVGPHLTYSDGRTQHFTYATQDMFENLLK